MSKKELNRLDIINRLIRRDMTGSYAAGLLNLSLRQIWRIRDVVQLKGPSALLHGNRGRHGNNKIPDNERSKIVSLLHKRYPDFKPTLASEKLAERHHIARDTKTIRAIMIDEGLWVPKAHKGPEDHRQWRQRKAAYIDGSVHIRLRGKYLSYAIVPKRQEKRAVPWILSQQPQSQKQTYAKPAADHPWRRPFLPVRSTTKMAYESSHEPIVAHSAS